MDKDLKVKWVKALRSGEYKQCRNDWMNGGCFCCVGVLLSITGSSMDDPRGEALELIGLSMERDDNSSSTRLQVLINLNDIEEKSFSEIADYIEAHY